MQVGQAQVMLPETASNTTQAEFIALSKGLKTIIPLMDKMQDRVLWVPKKTLLTRS